MKTQIKGKNEFVSHDVKMIQMFVLEFVILQFGKMPF